MTAITNALLRNNFFFIKKTPSNLINYICPLLLFADDYKGKEKLLSSLDDVPPVYFLKDSKKILD
jgi:hypothetical protein